MSVVKNDNLGESVDPERGIEWLRERFINLKNEQRKLNAQQRAIAKETEKVRADEKKTLGQMKTTLYTKQKEM